MKQHLKDDGDLRRYYSQIPHLADEEMDPYEMRLYVHYKRVCGGGGECYETTETTATNCRMSERKVQTTRQLLIDKNWIRAELRGRRGKARMYITLIDRWNDNYNRFSNEATSTPAPDAPVHVMHPLPPHDMHLTPAPDAPVHVMHPLPPHDMHLTPAPDAPKRKTNKEKPIKEKKEATPPPSHPFITAYREQFKRFPNAQQMAELSLQPTHDAAVNEWKAVLKEWAMSGWNFMNVKGQLERFSGKGNKMAPPRPVGDVLSISTPTAFRGRNE